MNDDQLTRLFRSLDEQAEPDQAFNESLFARLEREAHIGAYRRRTSARWVLLAAALLAAAAIGAAAAVGSGLVKFPFELAVASATPTPSETPTTSASASGNESASASPTQTPVTIPEPTGIDQLVAIPDGFLALGSAPSAGPDQSAVSVLLRGTSDGTSWTSMDVARFGLVTDVAVNQTAWVMLTNTSPTLEGTWVIWRSTDGQNWTPIDNWTTEKNVQLYSIAAGPAGFAISGISGPGPGNSRIWTSADGTRWTRYAPSWDSALGLSAIVLDRGFVVYGSQMGADAHIIASLDGRSWETLPSPPGTAGKDFISAMMALGATLDAVTCGSQCSVWAGTLEGSAGSLAIRWQSVGGGTQLLNGSALTSATASSSGAYLFGYKVASRQGQVWTSTDGTTWNQTALAADAFGGGMPSQFAAGPSGLVSLGWTDATLAGIGRDLRASPDGVTWSKALAPLVPPPPQVPGGACPAKPTTVKGLADLGFVKAASCYGDEPLTLHGYSSNCGGCGGTSPFAMSPQWMSGAISAIGYAWYLSPVVTQPGGAGERLGVELLPSAHLTPPSEGTAVTVTGHFNDAVSPSCTITVIATQWYLYEQPPVAPAENACRTDFVVTAITATGS